MDAGMTAVELRERLIESFRSSGVVDDLKAKLRASFIHDLACRGQLALDGRQRRSVSMQDRMVNSLVAEHLRVNRLDCTLSVFLPEAGYVVHRGTRSCRPLLAATPHALTRRLTFPCRLHSDPLSREEIKRSWAQHAADASRLALWDSSRSLLSSVVDEMCSRGPHMESFAQTDPMPEPSLGAQHTPARRCVVVSGFTDTGRCCRAHWRCSGEDRGAAGTAGARIDVGVVASEGCGAAESRADSAIVNQVCKTMSS
jgi:hypothetical protein